MKNHWNWQVGGHKDDFKKYKASDYPNGIYTMTMDDVDSVKMANAFEKEEKHMFPYENE